MEIYNKQNEKKYLNLLFASRKIYNYVNYFNIASLTLSVLLALIGLFDINKNIGVLILIAIMSSFVLFFQFAIPIMLKYAGNMRNYVDYSLFGIGNKIDNKDKITEITSKICCLFKKQYHIQTTNSGDSKARGVMNWYSKKESNDMNEIIFHCQKENIWFDKKICTIYLLIIIILFIIINIIFIIINKNLALEKLIIKYLLMFPILLDCTVIVINYKKYSKVSHNIYYQIDSINKNNIIEEKELNKLQELIGIRREINFTPPNFIHRIISSYLHKIKSDINNN